MPHFADNPFFRTRNDVQAINALAEKEPDTLIARSDLRLQKHIESAARQIAARGARLVLLSGPSGSGKTTAARFLAEALTRLSHPAKNLSTDDFYLGAARAPRRPNGEPDLECPEAMDLPALQACVRGLALNSACETPVFDFSAQRPSGEHREIRLGKDGVAVLEGIHALNPLLTQDVPDLQNVVRVFLSVQQEVRIGPQVLLSPPQVRLVRRIVRDFRFRSTSPAQTLHMWPAVMEGERKYITPWKAGADLTLNSLLPYEFGVLRGCAVPLLRRVEDDTPEGKTAQDLAFALALFHAIPLDKVPAQSLLREFIG